MRERRHGVNPPARGLLHVYIDIDGNDVLKDQTDKASEHEGELQTVFHNGNLTNEQKFEDVRLRLHG
jgi:hypothetical protein